MRRTEREGSGATARVAARRRGGGGGSHRQRHEAAQRCSLAQRRSSRAARPGAAQRIRLAGPKFFAARACSSDEAAVSAPDPHGLRSQRNQGQVTDHRISCDAEPSASRPPRCAPGNVCKTQNDVNNSYSYGQLAFLRSRVVLTPVGRYGRARFDPPHARSSSFLYHHVDRYLLRLFLYICIIICYLLLGTHVRCVAVQGLLRLIDLLCESTDARVWQQLLLLRLYYLRVTLDHTHTHTLVLERARRTTTARAAHNKYKKEWGLQAFSVQGREEDVPLRSATLPRNILPARRCARDDTRAEDRCQGAPVGTSPAGG